MAEVATAPVETPILPAEAIDRDQPVSIEIDGREFTGVGETEASLREGLPKPTEQPAPKLSKGRQRYSDLTSERDAERQQREAAEQERDALKTRLEALSAPSAPAPQREAPRQAVPVAAPPPPAPKFTPQAYLQWAQANPQIVEASDDPYAVWSGEVAAQAAAWQIQQLDLDAKIRQSIEADRAQRAFADSQNTVFERGRAAYPDFDAVRTQGPGAIIDLAPTRDQAITRYRAILASPQSEHLQYAIGSNANLARRLGSMSDVEFGMALASLAPTIPVASPASTAVIGSSMPPPPMQPVGSGSKTTVLSAADLAERGTDDYDSSGFREQLRRERGRR